MFLSLFLGLCMMSARAQALETNKNHNWARFAGNTVASMGVAFGGKTALKAMINEERPDHSDNKSFPSGHAAIGYGAAELTWYLSDKLFGRSSNLSITTTGQTLDVVYIF